MPGTIFYGWSPVSTGVRQSLANVIGLLNAMPLAEFAVNPTTLSCSRPNSPCATPADFVDAASQLDFGNADRNTLRGPGFLTGVTLVTVTMTLAFSPDSVSALF